MYNRRDTDKIRICLLYAGAILASAYLIGTFMIELTRFLGI
jgi:hypothetical protein